MAGYLLDTTTEGWVYDSTIGETSDSISVSGTNVSLPPQNQTPQSKFGLYQNYPNPFNQTTIKYDIEKGCQVTLKIYNLAGQLVKTLINEYQTAGPYEIKWYGKNDAGEEVASGVYFYQLVAGDKIAIKKMVVLK